MNSLRRYTQLTAPDKPREAAVVFSPTEGCRGADVTSLQPAGMTRGGTESPSRAAAKHTSRGRWRRRALLGGVGVGWEGGGGQ